MRIVTCNVNGLRAAHGKGFFRWLPARQPDVACLREHGFVDAFSGPAPVVIDYHDRP